jgi:PAS domain S-box-containing protein
MLSYKKQLVFLITGVIVFVALFLSIYNEVRKKTIEELNNRQMVYARLAATAMEAYFEHQSESLNYLTQNDHIIHLDSQGKALMKSIQEIPTNNIEGVTRVSAKGVILFSSPEVPGAIGADISRQQHVREILRTHKPVMSDVFMAAQGFKAIAMHVPVYRGKVFDGTVAFLLSFDGLANKYLKDIKIEGSGYAWMINEQGTEIFCPVPGHVGRSVFETCKDFPDILEMARDMMKGKTGATTYTFEHKKEGEATQPVKKHAVYMPIKIGNTFWSVVVATPENAVLAPMKSFRNQLLVLILILFLVFTAIVYSVARAHSSAIAREKERKAQEDLLKSAKEVHDLYHHAPCGYHSLDMNGNILRMNDTELAWLGYTREELTGKPYADVVSEVSRENFASAFARVKQQGIVREVEYTMQRKDGSTFPVLVTASAVSGPDGEFVMTRSMVHDITEHKQQAERLRESEALYRTALENTSDGISIIQDQTYVYVNQRLMDTIGRPDENLVGQPVGIFVHPDDRIILRDNCEARRQGLALPNLNCDLRVIKPDQSIGYVNVSAVSIIYQGKPAVLAFLTDITGKKKTEDALRESEALYRTALESTSDGVSILQDGRYVYINQKFLNTLHIPHENPIGKPVGALVHRDDQERLKENYRKRLRGEPTSGSNDLRVVRPDRSIVYINATSVDIVYQGKPAVLSFIRDITEKKESEQVLQESEELYRTALETTSDGITITQDRKYVYANKKLMETIGRPDESLIGKTAGIYIHPDDRHLLEKNFQAYMKGEPFPSSSHELRILKPDGCTVVVSVVNVIITYKGRPATLAFITDITRQKKYEAALRESEELYRTALETTNDGISIIQDGQYVYANHKLLKTIGREEKGIIGLPLGVYTHPEDRGMVQTRYEARQRGEEVVSNYDMRVLKPDGSVVIINISAVNITYQGRPASLAFVLDITERKKAEEALRQSEERYRTIIESIDDDYFETDLKGTITFLNKPVSWSGHGREEMLGLNHQIYSTPEMAAKAKAVFAQIYRDGKPARMTDYEVRRKDGSIVHLEMSVSLIHDAQGAPVGFRGISRDVTERIKMDQERKKLTEQLYQAQKMEAIGTLAGGIAHDFNNLLMGIQGYTSIMLLEVDATHPYYEQLKAVQTLVQSGAGLTKQLLGFARSGRYEVKPTDLNDLISKSINLFGRTRKEIRIFEKYADNALNVEVDRGQIEQVLLNLFVNAWQAMPGGGSLYLETENVVFDKPSADLYDLKPGHYVKVAVTDTGVGMDEKTRQRIFDPFFTTKGMGRGTGLGLASAYGIIKGHGGMITVYSEKGQGTTFHIYLPASKKKAAFEEAPETELSGGRETILLVDDEEVITEVTSRLLSELGYTILTAGSGEQAVEIYRQRQTGIQLVILDMIMPGMSGGETFDQLRAVNPSIRVILSSGYSIDGKAQAIMKKGVRVFLQKPYRLHDLASKIREALSD